MNRIKGALGSLAFKAVILLAGIVIIEWIFGGWFKPDRLNWLNLKRDCRLEYDVSGLYRSTNPVITYTRDRYGLRGNFTDPARIDILTLGGSTTDQRYIRDGDTWQDVLQEQFARQGASVVVGNAGIDGQSTSGHIENFQWWFPRIPNLKPRFILFYVGLNDFYKDEGYDHDDLTGRYRNTVMQSIRSQSAVWYLIRTLRGAFNAMVVEKIGHHTMDFKEVRWSPDPLQKNYGFMQLRLNAYADRLRILADMSRSLGATPIFVSSPSRLYRVTEAGIEGAAESSTYDGYPYNGVDFYYMMKQYDSMTKVIAAEKNAFFIDLSSCGDWEDSDFYDLVHMTPQGAAKVGTHLHQALKRIVMDAVTPPGERMEKPR